MSRQLVLAAAALFALAQTAVADSKDNKDVSTIKPGVEATQAMSSTVPQMKQDCADEAQLKPGKPGEGPTLAVGKNVPDMKASADDCIKNRETN